jgi:hypothetical protein
VELNLHSSMHLPGVVLTHNDTSTYQLCVRYTQKNGGVSKVNKKFIAHLTRAQRTPSAAATVQVSHALPAGRSSCLLRGRGASVQDGVAAGKGLRPPSPLATPFAGSNTMRFLSLGVRYRQRLRTSIAHVPQGTS